MDARRGGPVQKVSLTFPLLPLVMLSSLGSDFEQHSKPRCARLTSRLYEKYLEFAPHSCTAWSKYAELEKKCAENERCRAIYELAIAQVTAGLSYRRPLVQRSVLMLPLLILPMKPVLDMPEVLWKAYIDFEIENKEHDRTRMLYERLLEKTKHVKVWISYAQFLAGIPEPDDARLIYDKAYNHLKSEGLKEERVLVRLALSLLACLPFSIRVPAPLPLALGVLVEDGVGARTPEREASQGSGDEAAKEDQEEENDPSRRWGKTGNTSALLHV